MRDNLIFVALIACLSCFIQCNGQAVGCEIGVDTIASRYSQIYGSPISEHEQCIRDYVVYGEAVDCEVDISSVTRCCLIRIDHVNDAVIYISELGMDIEPFGSEEELDEIVDHMMEHCYDNHNTEY